MKNSILKIGCVVALLGAVMMSGRVLEQAWACSSSSEVIFNDLTVPSEVHTTFDGEHDVFDFQLTFNWLYPDIPNIGVMEWDDTASSEIDSVSYDPAYFYPSECTGGLAIQATGDLVGGNENDGVLVTDGWCWDPLETDTKTVIIYRD